ncbi:hypothetical protein [Pseudohoeflea coraliihabitans]|uniref:Uncharacterized protein n=1 Tax=Pseudohoeflea coraliihabitans TaxID=2860393 RepID=A0ABS6WTI6_9HYPH|nr:hypothetical protein [Pseudohoeflea sp. DP4N28-3]MBW3099276.1 hypothetical protein [Pseudohoeflea sp. DP4N28-3]
MTDDEVRKIVADTVAETLIRLGIDAHDPKEMQADMQHLRNWRQSVNTVKRQSLLTAVGVVTTGILGLIYMALFHE